MAGRRPKPTALKILAGNPGGRRLQKRELRPSPTVPEPPAHLSALALTAWRALAPRFHRLGLLTELDGLALEQLVENYAEILDLRADIAQGGRFQKVDTTSGDEMERLRPAAKQLADAERRFRAMLAEFGLTPSARTRVAVSLPKTPNEFASLA